MSKVLAVSVLMVLSVLVGGCAALQTARTEAHWQISESQYVDYDSNKDQQGLEIKIDELNDEGKVVRTIYLKADKSGTPEMLFQLMAQQSQLTASLVERLAEMAKEAR